MRLSATVFTVPWETALPVVRQIFCGYPDLLPHGERIWRHFYKECEMPAREGDMEQNVEITALALLGFVLDLHYLLGVTGSSKRIDHQVLENISGYSEMMKTTLKGRIQEIRSYIAGSLKEDFSGNPMEILRFIFGVPGKPKGTAGEDECKCHFRQYLPIYLWVKQGMMESLPMEIS